MKFQTYIVEKNAQEELDKENVLKYKITEYLNKHIASEDSLERFAKENDVSITELYYKIAEILNQFLYRKKNDIEIDREQLEKGIEHEYEHFDSKKKSNRDIAKIIALDHLKQIPDYYDKLETFDKD
jgi:hypothetical protein